MYFNVFFKLIKVHLLVSDLYIYQKVGATIKKKVALLSMSFIKPCNHSYHVVFLYLKSHKINLILLCLSYTVCSSGLQTKYSKSLIIIIVMCAGNIINSRIVCVVEPCSYSGHTVSSPMLCSALCPSLL